MSGLNISDRIQRSVRRSLCVHHYNKFYYLHSTIRGFGNAMSKEAVVDQHRLLSFFPTAPAKIGRRNWVKFGFWLEDGIGKRMKHICLPWVDYGVSAIDVCKDCKEASVLFLHDEDDFIIRSERDKKNGEENNETNNVENDGKHVMEDVKCNSDCDCPSDCDEKCECVRYQKRRKLIHNHNVISTQVYYAVERSMCSEHLKQFWIFHDNLFEFCECISFSAESVKEIVYNIFRNPPKKVGHREWGMFSSWIANNEDKRLAKICADWSKEAHNYISSCVECRDACYGDY